ncbi:hypothetical protein UA17_01762 [Burkholderia multivorans]|nr:hypothetical protein UA17_01762 [Burkholderia multivorans]
MAKGVKTGGRQKGTPNKTTANVKEAIEKVAAGLGGAEGMLAWAQSDPVNERIFWSQIYPKVLPKEIKAEHEVAGVVQVVATSLDEGL